ncbi:MAG TPA: zinc ribbon domain-containing protein [Pyrinomonadaceae bacterium]|nr:zinc ribbon domain-containing protein [Pyrinomonadaceae bacterium]
MHCPKCGQHQAAEDTRFCSRCGFLLTGIADVVAHNGMIPTAPIDESLSPRKAGVFKGLFMILSLFLIVPIIAMITIAARAEPFAVFFALFVLGVGGLLRIAYALMFESTVPGARTLEQKILRRKKPVEIEEGEHRALPPERSVPVGVYAPPTTGKWLDTNELDRPVGSVTDSTTKLLQKEADRQ